jgi:ATPase subunit of ABC transporter with duplicated ATPase domains
MTLMIILFHRNGTDTMVRLEEEITDPDSPAIQDEFLTASSLLVDLEAELETVCLPYSPSPHSGPLTSTQMPLPALEARARTILTALGFTETTLAKTIPTLSGGWRMRAALARALLQKVDLLILDEPTNFLDLRAIIWLQSHLVALRDSEAGTTVLLVSHDREFVDTVAEEVILVKDQGLEYFRGNLSAYEEDFRSRVLNLTRMQEAQGKETARLEKSIQQTIKIGKKTGDDNKLRMAKSRQKRLEDGAGMQVNEKGQRFKLSDRMGEDAPFFAYDEYHD